ncbi:MAG: polyprenyl synthetase family protein [Schwartzia sp.]|nr:polyprenyl synthetase family protein [Schwartzia sp. (in: firmicutes)]MBO6211197.1 polyprenyl synthetase family protein [Schwartzia sp. (in: firmicutes)]MBO6235593.1 polyprenyl synthetase family protein [Schwartzia sp. (in: firmicutes)]MBO6295287.1 polyprenyl synthetase family protein [Schwartzia sp. (in: firmicutes)]MBP3690801.1 polyprenyl synthetase family protein [Schwartzia sp. (in: firmicutes)]
MRMQKEEWARRRALVEEGLLRELREDEAFDARLAESMKYSLMAGGKRLRPILLMAAADAAGGHGDDYLASACALEMIHTYSLIHDDLPAMDNDDYRRGRLTNHKVYGAGLATLAGDALLTLAFEVLLRQKGVSPETLVRVVREISTAAGPEGMVGGQALDLESEGKHIDRDTLRRMHMAKTGALFRAAVRSGAILAGADDAKLAALTEYAEAFGLAFQITDDILDVTGDEAAIGKPVGSDERNQKSTYVTLTSLDEAKRLAREAVDRAHQALAPLGEKAAFLDELAEYLITRDR